MLLSQLQSSTPGLKFLLAAAGDLKINVLLSWYKFMAGAVKSILNTPIDYLVTLIKVDSEFKNDSRLSVMIGVKLRTKYESTNLLCIFYRLNIYSFRNTS